MPDRTSERRNLPQIWLKAAMLGSLWASVEIVLGSFLHNLRVPLSGTLLAALGVIVMINGYKLWPEKGLFWRTALVTALMKSISPSAIVLGPMVGIFMEGLLLETTVRLFRRHWMGFILGGALAVSWSLVQKIFTLILTYGPDFVLLYEKLYLMAAKTLRLDPGGSSDLVLLIFILDLLFGAVVAGITWKTQAARERQIEWMVSDPTLESGRSFLTASVRQTYSIQLLVLNLVAVVVGLQLIEALDRSLGLGFVLLYVSLVSWRYSHSLARLKRPQLWIQLLMVMGLSGLLLGGFQNSEAIMTGLLTGVSMATRALLIIFGFAALSIELRNPRIIDWFKSHGMGVLFESVSLAFEVLPLMIKLLGQVKQTIRHPFKTLLTLLAALEQLRQKHEPPLARVLFLTGGQGAGKTKILNEYLLSSPAKDIDIQGILTDGVWRNGQRDHYFVRDISNQEKRLLCGRDLPVSKIKAGPFHFREEGIRFGQQVLQRALETSPDLVVIDEIGHLERYGQGWSKQMDGLVRKGQMMLWSVRPSLLDEIAAKWPIEYRLIATEAVDIEQLGSVINAFIEGN